MVVAVMNALAHKDFFKVWNCWIVFWHYKGEDSIVCFSLLEGPFTSFKFHFCQRVNNVFQVL